MAKKNIYDITINYSIDTRIIDNVILNGCEKMNYEPLYAWNQPMIASGTRKKGLCNTYHEESMDGNPIETTENTIKGMQDKYRSQKWADTSI